VGAVNKVIEYAKQFVLIVAHPFKARFSVVSCLVLHIVLNRDLMSSAWLAVGSSL